jgi:hypothetical protein
MKRFINFSLVILALCIAACAQTYSNDGFKADFPGAVSISNQSSNLRDGSVVTFRMYTAAGDGVAYMAGVGDYASTAQRDGALGSGGTGLEAELRNSEAGAIKNAGATEISSMFITTPQGYEGIEYRAQITQNGVTHYIHGRIFLLWNTLYQALVIYDGVEPFSSTRFLNSFMFVQRIN